MEVKFIGKGKSRAQVELVGETHTFANAIRAELWNDDKVDNSAYEKSHPYLGNPVLLVQSEKEDPVAALKKASKRMSANMKSLGTEFSKAFK